MGQEQGGCSDECLTKTDLSRRGMKLPLENCGKPHNHKGGSQGAYKPPHHLLKGQNGGEQKFQEISGKKKPSGVQVADKLTRGDTQLDLLLKKTQPKKKKQPKTTPHKKKKKKPPKPRF